MSKFFDSLIPGSQEIIVNLKITNGATKLECWPTFDLVQKAPKTHSIKQNKLSYLINDLKPGTSYSFKISNDDEVLEWSRTVTLVPPSIYRIFQSEEKRPRIIEELKKEFFEYKLNDDELKLGTKSHNILMLGAKGSGKSNLITSLRSIFEGRFEGGSANFAGSKDGKPTTSILRKLKFRFTNALRLYDIFGFYLNEDGEFNYSEKMFDQLLKGNLKDFTSEKNIQEALAEIEKNETDISEEVHSAILVLDANTLESDENLEKETVFLINMLNQREIHTTIVLTKLDIYLNQFYSKNCQQFQGLYHKDIDYKSERIFKHPEAMRLMELAKEKYNLNSVFPFVNFTNNNLKNELDPAMCFLGLSILKEVSQKSRQYIHNAKPLLRVKHVANKNDGKQSDYQTVDLGSEKPQKEKPVNADILIRLEKLEYDDEMEIIYKEFDSRYENGLELGEEKEKKMTSKILQVVKFENENSIPFVEEQFSTKAIDKLNCISPDILIYNLSNPIGVVRRFSLGNTLNALREKISRFVECRENFKFAKKGSLSKLGEELSPAVIETVEKKYEDRFILKDHIDVAEELWDNGSHFMMIVFEDAKTEVMKVKKGVAYKDFDEIMKDAETLRVPNGKEAYSIEIDKTKLMIEVLERINKDLSMTCGLAKMPKAANKLRPGMCNEGEMKINLEDFIKKNWCYFDPVSRRTVIFLIESQ